MHNVHSNLFVLNDFGEIYEKFQAAKFLNARHLPESSIYFVKKSSQLFVLGISVGLITPYMFKQYK